MRKNLIRIAFVFILATFVLSSGLTLFAASGVSIMTKEELKAQLGSSDIVILDVRSGTDWKSSEFKIKGSKRANPREFNTWAETYPKDKTLVLYCA